MEAYLRNLSNYFNLLFNNFITHGVDSGVQVELVLGKIYGSDTIQSSIHEFSGKLSKQKLYLIKRKTSKENIEMQTKLLMVELKVFRVL